MTGLTDQRLLPGPVGRRHTTKRAPGPHGRHPKSDSRGAVGRTVVLWADITIKEVGPDDQPVPNGAVVWRMTDDNRDSYFRRLKAMIEKVSGWSMTGAEFFHATEPDAVAAALKGGGISRVVWVGHVFKETRESGALAFEGFDVMSDKGWLDGDKFARMLPDNIELRFLGCLSTPIAAQIRSIKPSVRIYPSSGDRQIQVDFAQTEDQQVLRINFKPWTHR